MLQSSALDLLRADLQSFADPNSELEVTEFEATWIRSRQIHSAKLMRGDGALPNLQYSGRDFSYSSFFASDHMADLAGLSESILNGVPRTPSYVESRARLEGESSSTSIGELLVSLSTSNLPYSATRVVFLRGGAGAGKTSSLRNLVLQQAEQVSNGRSSTVFLYVDAQSRALSRLDEAVAAILQDLGASFTYRALASLTRLGLVVPIIDGFDELIGTGGYGEAFSSLALFLSRLSGQGSVIASARSTFLEYRAFRESADRYEKSTAFNFQISPVEMLPWTSQELGNFLVASGALVRLGASSESEGIQRLEVAVGSDGRQFLETPFFVASLVELLTLGGTVDTGRRLVPQLIEFFISRESTKIVDSDGQPIGSIDIHHKFLEMLAEEMWWLESNQLDVETVKTLAELVLEGLPLSTLNRITFVEKAATYAFLDSRSREARKYLAFTHEYYHSYFLSHFFLRSCQSEDGGTSAISRGRIPSTVGEEFAFAVREQKVNPRLLASKLANRRIPSLTRDINLENAGTLLAGLIKYHGPSLDSQNLGPAVFLQSDLGGSKLSGVTFVEAQLLRCKLVDAVWKNIKLDRSQLVEPLVSPHGTKLTGTELRLGDDLRGLVIGHGDDEETIYDPQRLALLVRQMGGQSRTEAPEVQVSNEAEALQRLLRKFLRVASRFFYISNEDLQRKGILSDPRWPALERILTSSNLLEEVQIQKRGPTGLVRKLAVPPSEIEQAEAGKTNKPNVESFWRKLKES